MKAKELKEFLDKIDDEKELTLYYGFDKAARFVNGRVTRLTLCAGREHIDLSETRQLEYPAIKFNFVD